MITAFVILTEVSSAKTDSTSITVQKIRLYGNQLYTSAKVSKLLSIPLNRKMSLVDIKGSIKTLLEEYKKENYYFSQIDSIVFIYEKQNMITELILFLTEGNEFHINRLLLNIEDYNLKQSLEALIALRHANTPPRQIENQVEKILVYMENNGYPFCEIYIDSIVIKNEDLDTYLSIKPGPVVRIDDIDINGNNVTKNNVIIRELRIKKGEIYNHSNILKIPQRLSRLGFFKNITEPYIQLTSDGKGELNIEVTEGNMNSIDGVVGYNPGRLDSKGYFTGLIDLSLTNLLGTGRRIDAYWEKKDQKSQQLKFSYVEPWLFGLPFHVGGSFQQLIQDTSYIKRNWTFDVNLPISDRITLFSNMGNEIISPDSTGAVLWNIPKSRSWLINLGVTYDNRSDQFNPIKGIFYQTTVEFSKKRIIELSTQNTSFDRKKITLDMELYIPTFKWQVIGLALHGRQVSSTENEVAISDLYRFGGSKTMRGFREDEFLGAKIAWINTEYRYLLAERSRAFIFIDGGYFSRTTTGAQKVEDFKLGYGFGVRIETRLGIIGIDYGLAKGRNLSNGLVHVRLINKF